MHRICAALLLVAVTGIAQKPAFEVATVKLSLLDRDGGSAGVRADRFVATNVNLRTLMSFAYRTDNESFLPAQLIGGPSWTNTDRFDVEAKLGGTSPSVPMAQVRLMLQSLLEDRFQLKAHRETRELPVYELVVAKSGLKIKPAEDQSAPPPGTAFINFDMPRRETSPLPRGAMRLAGDPSNTTLTAVSVPISKLVSLLQGQSDRMILDKTGLTALFDFKLDYRSEAAAAVDAGSTTAPPIASFFTAIQDLGLKLEPTKASMPVVVIDSVQKLQQ